ncbi:unnamed protein product [Prunus armeniaca]
METIFRWSREAPKYDKEELCTLELHHFGMLENGVYGGKVCYVDNCIHDYLSLLDLKKIGIDLGYKVDITQRVTSLKVYYKGPVKSGQYVVNEVVNDSCILGLVGSISSDQVLVLYYHDHTHNNELESEDKGQQQHSEDVGNEDEYEEEDEEKENVIVDSDYELSEEEEDGMVLVEVVVVIAWWWRWQHGGGGGGVSCEGFGGGGGCGGSGGGGGGEGGVGGGGCGGGEGGVGGGGGGGGDGGGCGGSECGGVSGGVICFWRKKAIPNGALMKLQGIYQMMMKIVIDFLLMLIALVMRKKVKKTKTSKRKWKKTNFKQFRKETDLRNPEFRIGMRFANKDELKEAIKEYAIMQGRNVKLVNNDNKRIQAKCAGHTKCHFILFASKIYRDEQTFGIKTLSLEHECTRVDKLKYTNSRWLSKRFADKIRKNPEWDVGAFKAEVLEKYHMNVSKHKIYRAKNLSKVIIEGSYVEPLIGIDGCHLKGPYTWQVLTVVGVDGNNGLYPVAYVVVEQKGLIPAIETLLPTAKHRMCVRHLYSNFRTEHAGHALKNIPWAAARATTIPYLRDKSILTCLEMIRVYIMLRMDNRRIAGTVWRHPIGPRIVKIIEKNKLGASQCIPRLVGESKYQANVFDYAHDCYKKTAYLSSYEPMVRPIPSMDQWQRTNWPPIKPPPYKKQPGRPKKLRNKEPADVEVPVPVPPNPLPPFYNPPPTKLRRINVKIRCSICGQEGRNKTRHANQRTTQVFGPFLISSTNEQLALLQSKGQLRPFLISPTNDQLPLLQSKGQLRGRGRGTTIGRGKGNGRGEMPTGRGNVGNGTTEMPNNFSSSQPLPSASQPVSYTRAISSSSQPPKSLAKRFKSPAKKLKPWMF